MVTSRQRMRKDRIKKRRRRIFFLAVMPLLTLLLAGIVYSTHLIIKATSTVDDSYEEIDREKPLPEVNPKKDNFSILLLGVDDSEARGFDSGARTDAMIVATFNGKERSVKMLSIPRDSYVYYPERGQYSRINHAHAWDGVTGSIDRVEDLLDIDINYFIKMNFHAFIDVVDALNGVTVDVPYDLSEMDSKDKKDAIKLEQGIQTLNGEEALALARTRKKDSDFERGKRQQQILKAIIDKSLTLTGISKYSNVIDALGNNISLNMTPMDLTGFFNYVAAGSNLDIDMLNLKGSDSYDYGAYYFMIDEESLQETKDVLQGHLNRK